MDSSIVLREYRLVDPWESLECHGQCVSLTKCPERGRKHVSDPDKCECCGPNSQTEQMSKRILECIMQNGDKPHKAVGVTPPSEFSENVSRNTLHAREQALEKAPNAVKDEGDHDISTMMSDVLDIHKEVLYTEKIDFVSNQCAIEQHAFQDENFIGVRNEKNAK